MAAIDEKGFDSDSEVADDDVADTFDNTDRDDVLMTPSQFIYGIPKRSVSIVKTQPSMRIGNDRVYYSSVLN